MFGSIKKKLTPEERTHYYMTLKELNDSLGFNYFGSVLFNHSLKVLEEHTADVRLKKTLSESIGTMLKRFKKLKRIHIPVIEAVYPFNRFIISLQAKYLIIVMSEHYIFVLYLGKRNLNIGTVMHIICPKIAALLKQLESEK